MKIGSLCIAVMLFSACTWVKPEPGAEGVALVNPEHLVNCQKLGNVYANTHHRLVGVNRSGKKVSEEILTLAKNEALSMGADTITESSPLDNGEQSFIAYKCAKP